MLGVLAAEPSSGRCSAAALHPWFLGHPVQSESDGRVVVAGAPIGPNTVWVIGTVSFARLLLRVLNA